MADDGETYTIRIATIEDSVEVTVLWLRSRRASIPAIPAPVHTDDEVRDWITLVMRSLEVWVATTSNREIVAVLVLENSSVDQLYVDPHHVGRGLGSRLISLAKQRHPTGVDLWTFHSNRAARRFYEQHGFIVIETTDGANEEGAPDVHHHWGAASGSAAQ